MPIIQADAKSLEVFCGAFLSQDKVLMEELRTPGMDMHKINQRDVLGLGDHPDGRLIAKIFLFR